MVTLVCLWMVTLVCLWMVTLVFLWMVTLVFLTPVGSYSYLAHIRMVIHDQVHWGRLKLWVHTKMKGGGKGVQNAFTRRKPNPELFNFCFFLQWLG